MIINHLHGNDKVSALPIPLQNRGLLVKLKKFFWAAAGSPGVVLQSPAAHPGHGPCQSES